MAIEIRRLRPDDDRSDFRSGNIDLDRFFQRYAGQNQFRHHIGTTYVAVDGEAMLVWPRTGVLEAAVLAEHSSAPPSPWPST